MAEENDKYPLHKAVFENDLPTLFRLLRKTDLAAKDKHGNLIISFSLYDMVRFL